MVLEKAWQFFMKSYYKIITNDDHSFPWWMAKHVEGESSFKGGVFLLGLQLREILILDTLKRRNICLVNWCCMCQCSEESVDHLLIHCTQVSSLCSLVFFLFGVSWVIPKHMVELLACWKGGFGCYLAADIWWAIPLCLMWTIWREQNLCTFEEKKHSILNLKRFFSFSLCDWMSVRSDPLFSSHVDFLDLCSLDDLSRLL